MPAPRTSMFLRLHDADSGELLLLKWTHIASVEPVAEGGSDILTLRRERPFRVRETPHDVLALIADSEPALKEDPEETSG